MRSAHALRLLVSRRHLLDWVTAAQAEVSRRLDLAGFYRQMAAASSSPWRGARRVVAASAWRLAAGVAVRARSGSRRRRSRDGRACRRASRGDRAGLAGRRRALRLVARRTWRFFETFVTAEDHWLPPDNFQEDPKPVVAHRTSPTNLGLYLLSAVSARDFGWSGTIDDGRAARSDARDDGQARALPRPLLQLVRHARPAAARPAVRLVGRQRQPRRTPDRARQCVPRVDRRRAPDVPRPASRAGIDDALDLTRAALRALPGDAAHADARARSSSRARARRARRHALASRAAGEAGAARRDDGRHRAGARERARRRGRRRMLFWAEAHARRSRATAATSAGRDRALDARVLAALALAASARALAGAMDFGFLLDRERKLLSIGYRVADGQLDPSCYDLLASEARLASFVAIAKGDVAVAALVPPRARRHPDRRRRGAHLLVGIDVRVPDAVARHARAGREPARADQPPGRAPADRLRRRARRALGRLGVGLQRARPRAHLPVFELRRPGPGPEARAARERRHRALRDGARGDGRSGRAARNFAAAAPPPARAGATASTRRSTTRRRACPRGRRVAMSCAPSWRTTRA